MSVISKGRRARRFFGNLISRGTGLLVSALLLVLMTVWATSSPFSPLAPQRQSVLDEHEYLAPAIPERVNEQFSVSESILPSRTAASVSYLLQSERSSAISDVDELALLEKTHVQRETDSSAWNSFRRQDSLSAARPIVRSAQQPSRQELASASMDLPEVHFATAKLQPLPMLPEPHKVGKGSRLPSRLRSVVERSSEASQQPIRTAVLPRYIAPYGNQNVTNNQIQFSAPLPIEPQRKSWETGRY